MKPYVDILCFCQPVPYKNNAVTSLCFFHRDSIFFSGCFYITLPHTDRRISAQSEQIVGRTCDPEKEKHLPKEQQSEDYKHIVRAQAFEKRSKELRNELTRDSLMVETRVPGQKHGTPERLQDYMKRVPDRPEVPEEQKTMALREAQKVTRGACLDNISKYMQSHRNINTRWPEGLSNTDRQRIREKGDKELISMVQHHKNGRQHERARSPGLVR